MSDAREKGRELERRISVFLQSHDYEVETNVVRRGRSGAHHELDVVAVKRDGLTSFELIVECKAWETPIDKEIVYKLAAELSDLGAAKGVIATLSGWTVQAQQAAAQANIEMWGPEELSTRLGSSSLSQLHFGPKQLMANGLPFQVDSQVAFVTVGRAAKGTLGVGKEEIVLYGAIWLPTWTFQLGITRNEGLLKRTARSTSVWNGYDALASNCVYRSTSPPSFFEVDLSNDALGLKLKESDVLKFLNGKISKWRQSTKPEVKKREAVSLARLGIQVPVASLTVEASSLVYLPLWVAVVTKRSQERVIAIDGVTGIESGKLSETLTKNIQRVKSSLVH